MKSVYKLALLAAVALPTALPAQLVVDRNKYPDYDPTVRPDRSLRHYGSARKVKGGVVPPLSQRPAYVNNAANMYFPPVFNQEGGSCGSASRIGYMFTYEMNAYRGTDASKFENQYPTHFVWLLTNGNSGKDEFVQFVGVPSAKTYGGRMNSALFGYKEETNNDFGWMTGYDKWFEAMNSRMTQPTHIPSNVGTEEGREQLKNWLWNHNGDPDFHAGGIAGIGVASAATLVNIPNTSNNQAAGVVGQKYVKYWGKSVDHALTIVGYDDRIEFDLDGNGISGEKDKDEVGAWIIANSWGLWANNGLVYCPYAIGGPVHSEDANGKRVFSGGYWSPELYHVRKDYRPFRTIKVKMDYSRRSELLLQVGVSANLNATKPDAIIDLHHFRWAGDGHNGSIGTGEKDQKELPEIPMLGKWADGKLHTEPMEFGYDLTDLSAGFDRSRPLKYFFIINTRTKSNNPSKAKGNGHLYNVSVLDYEFDKAGVETPFKLETKDGEDNVAIEKGKIATYSTIVYGEQFFAPTNAAVSHGTFTWSAPQACGHKVKEYKVFVNGVLRGTTQTLSYPVSDAGAYGVKAVYEGGHETAMISTIASVAKQEENVAVDLKQTGFTIPDIFKEKFPNCTIEFWMKPHSLSNWNQSGGPGWGTFMCHANADGTYTAGWNTGGARADAGGTLRTNQWTHIAMVAANATFRLYANGQFKASSSTSGGHNGLGGFGNLVFNSGNNGQDAVYDEIRIWSKARTTQEITGGYNHEFSGELMPQGLIAYYKGDIITIDGKPYLRDCVGGHHAPINGNGYKQVKNEKTFTAPSASRFSSNGTAINGAKPVQAGQPLTLTAVYQDHTSQLEWNAPDANINNYTGSELTLVFPKDGKYKVSLKVKDGNGQEKTVEKEITVTPAASCSADFTTSLKEVPAGQRVSFNPTNPVPGFEYEWSMPGGSVATSNAISAGTSYELPGKHEVTLTVTSPSGEKRTTKQVVNVVNVAPEAAFSIQNAVVLKGEKGTMTNESKFRPTQLDWSFASAKSSYVKHVDLKSKQDNELEYKVNEPGVYDVTLKASNEVGVGTATQPRGLIVVNADSKNGLSFNHLGASVELAQQPITKDTKNFTIDWWMNPSKLADFCCGIGDVDNTFQIKVDYRGRLVISKNGLNVKTDEGTVTAGEWHHYAVSFSNGGSPKVYVDGQIVRTTGSVAAGVMPNLARFTLGNESADMNGQIDEFRIWEKVLTANTIKKYANIPLEGETLEAAKANDKLKVYYNFNQTSGDVADLAGNGFTGVRKNFGPEGDAWALSRGVFSLNLESQEQDVTRELKNNRASFQHTNKQINGTSGRWYQLKDWQLENEVTSADGKQITGAHYDRDKGGTLTVTSGWDNFQNLKDHKVFQVVHLEPGAYSLTATFGQHGESANCYLAAALGNHLPNTDALASALSHTALKPGKTGDSSTLEFVVTEPSDVALGIVANMSGNKIFCIHNFKLTRREVNTITAIEGVKANAHNANSEGTYDLSGRRVEKTESGQVYIKNGQRIVAE